MDNDFAIFILTHGRPDSVVTYKKLNEQGYTGKIYIVIDSEDQAGERYKEKFGDKVIVFDKKDYANDMDIGDNFKENRGVVYARNATFKIAENIGIKYFMVMDDDYIFFHHRYYNINNFGVLPVHDLDSILNKLLSFYKNIDALSIAIAQGGDFIGGDDARFRRPNGFRKCMNSFICSTDRPFKFFGRSNEDVTTYITLGSKGKLFFTIPWVSLTQKETQQNIGGMTELYLDQGTYVKSFYTVMYQPSSVKVGIMQTEHKRLHHVISWNNTVPQIIREEHKKVV